MTTETFYDMVRSIPKLGMDWHRETLIANSTANKPHMHQSIRELPAQLGQRVLVASAGPSLRRNLEELSSTPTDMAWPNVVAVDGAYIACLEAGIFPDYVITLDPHPTRIVRWFGDPDLSQHIAEDDYFARQDLDEKFRANMAQANAENIQRVDGAAWISDLIICSTAPANVVARTAAFDRYWFAPLVDQPRMPGSLTRDLARITGLPSLNTGGTVGTAAVVFAHTVLAAKSIAVIGMDLGYAKDLPLERTQSWNMLKDKPQVEQYYPRVEHPDWGECYTDPTYWTYRDNLLGLLKTGNITLHNCTGAGALFGPHVQCGSIAGWLNG